MKLSSIKLEAIYEVIYCAIMGKYPFVELNIQK